MITTVTNSAALIAALGAAHAGDTVLLAPGTYTPIRLINMRMAGEVVIASQDPAHAAVMTGLDMRDVSGLTFRDLVFAVTPSAGDSQFQAQRDSNITFDRIDMHGTLNAGPQDDVGGLVIKSSTNITVTNSEFHQLYWGLQHQDVDGLTLSDNSFHDIRMDGIRGSGSSRVLVASNTFTDFFPNPGDHADAIQFWTSLDNSTVTDITVRDNVVTRGSGAVIQGVFMNSVGALQSFDNVLITHNLLLGTDYNGIAVLGATDVTVVDNTVVGFPDHRTWIRLEGVDTGVILQNILNVVVTTPDNHGVSQSGNTVVAPSTDAGLSYLGSWVTARYAPIGLHLTGGQGVDILTGGAGADTLIGGGGADVLTGGGGDDLYVTDAKSTIIETANGGVDTVRASVGYTLGNYLENLELTGSSGVVGNGNSLDNYLLGNDGANALRGKIGNDTLVGGAGADTLNGGAGNDLLTGGTGADTFVFLKGDGQDRITDWGAGGEHDRLDISALVQQGFTPTLSAINGGVMITFVSGDAVFLVGASLSGLHADPLGFIA